MTTEPKYDIGKWIFLIINKQQTALALNWHKFVTFTAGPGADKFQQRFDAIVFLQVIPIISIGWGICCWIADKFVLTCLFNC